MCFKIINHKRQYISNDVQITEKLKKLEIWGKAQRESARRPKSDWGKLEGRG